MGSEHCFLSQVINEHHPNKAVCAQDLWSRPYFDLCAETGLSSAGAWPLLGRFDTNTQTDATGNSAQPGRKHVSMPAHTEGKQSNPWKVSPSPPLCNCSFLRKGQGQHHRAQQVDLQRATPKCVWRGTARCLLHSAPSPSLLYPSTASLLHSICQFLHHIWTPQARMVVVLLPVW